MHQPPTLAGDSFDHRLCNVTAPPVKAVGKRPDRFGVPRDDYYRLDPQVEDSAEEFLERLARHAELIEAPLADWQEDINACSFPIALFEVVRDLTNYLATYRVGISLRELVAEIRSPDVRGLMTSLLGDGAVPEQLYREALIVREKMTSRYQAYFEAHQIDALVFPTTPLPARPIEGDMKTVAFLGESVDTFSIYIRNTDPASVIGVPAVSFPIAPTRPTIDRSASSSRADPGAMPLCWIWLFGARH